ncbi:MAG: hypothetical protein AVDCRST_MAG85-1354 [uncultured Solirubrobacteraceae bacterium]|uniref:Uncharacterized protein n=1 Tax=uncultured Solirubrobacteraceae bacterium TaxID=1162706 RepID=A0A6J4SA36_9ACTN|nr:MAG: hypothetical protein AVDCRST_MAG85-1354 [uncultured Solirubrobacteraceae bacterium]
MGGNTLMFLLLNGDGSYSLACKDWIQNLWFLYTRPDIVSQRDVTWLGEDKYGTNRDSADSHFRLLTERDGLTWIYDTTRGEALTRYRANPWADRGYLSREDPSEPQQQRFVLEDAGEISAGDWRGIKDRWPT